MIKLLAIGLVSLALLALIAASAPTSDPAEAARLNNLGVAYMNQQLFEKALHMFEAAAGKDPGLKVATLNRGVALMNLQRADEAKALLEKAAKDDPNDAHSFYSLGLYYKNSSSPEAAIAAFRRVTEIDPDDADAWYFLASTYAQLKQFPDAIAAFEHALKLDPLHASAQFGLARTYQQSGQADSAHEAMKRFQYVTQNKLGTPISLAYGEQGKYSRAEESPLVPQRVPPQIPVKFVDVTKEAGLTSKDVPLQLGKFYPQAILLGSGACFLDYDGDGRVDLFVANNGPDGGIGLFHNLGNGRFEDVTKKAGLDPSLHAVGCTAGDYDNDGTTDLALSFDGRVMLLHNEKNGTFKDVTEQAGIKSTGPNAGLAFIDYDHDGDLDLYVAEATAPTIAEPVIYSLDPMLHLPPPPAPDQILHDDGRPGNRMWRNNGDGTFTDVTESTGLSSPASSTSAIGTDYNNDRAVDIVATGWHGSAAVFQNPREGKFLVHRPAVDFTSQKTVAVAALDFDHDGWTDLAFTQWWTKGEPVVTLWRNDHGKNFQQVKLPETNWVRAYGIVAFDYDNDGWVDLAAVGETKDGRGEVRLFRNLGPDGWKDVTTDVGLDKIELKEPRAIIAGDYDNDGAVDLLITQNHGPAVLLRNVGGNKNNSLRFALKGLNDNKSAIGTKVEVFSDGIRQKFEVYGSSGYLGQNSPYLTIGLGQAKQADVVRMLWPTGVLQDEVEVAANKFQTIQELDRRGSSCPTLFAWDGARYKLVGDMLGAGVIGHWVGTSEVPQGLKPSSFSDRNGTAEAVPFPKPIAEGGVAGPRPVDEASSKVVRNIPRPTEAMKLDRNALREKDGKLSFRFMEPLEESVYLDQVQLLAVDHPADLDVYPNEYFASNPPYPPFKVVFSNNKEARPPAGAWAKNGAKNENDERGHDMLPDLLAHRYFGDFKVLPFLGFAEPHSLELDLGEPYRGGPLWLFMHGEIEYFSANSMYAADQAGLHPFAPYVEALQEDSAPTAAEEGAEKVESLTSAAKAADENAAPTAALKRCATQNQSSSATCEAALHQNGARSNEKDRRRKWLRVIDDLGFPAGGARTMTADLTGKLPIGTRRIRLTTNLQIYWDNILISRTDQNQTARLTPVPLVRANLGFHGFPLKIEGQPPGNVKYIYEQTSATGPYTRPAGAYTRYGNVLPLLTALDDKFAVFGSGDEVALDFDPANLPALPPGWVRDYFFIANGYEKDMDFYAYRGDSVEPLPFGAMETYPYPSQSFPVDRDHENYLLEYNTRFMSGSEAPGYAFQYPDRH